MRLFPTEYFHLSAHKLNLYQLLVSWQFKFGARTFFEKSLFKADKKYWMRILKSNSRFRYMGFIIKDLVLTPFLALKLTMYYYVYRFLGENIYNRLRSIKKVIWK